MHYPIQQASEPAADLPGWSRWRAIARRAMR